MASFRRIPIEQCIVDPRYQRDLNPRHPALNDDFDAALLGVLEGSERESGEVAIFDGQHRLERLRREEMRTAPVMVHQGLTPEQEADLFRRLQEGRKALHPVETFRARLFAEDPVAVSMDGIARARGFRIGAGPGSLQAIVAVERIFNRGNLEETLDFIKLWEGSSRALEGSMMDGLSRFLDLYPEADRDRAKEVLAETSPAVIWRKMAEVVDQFRYSRSRAALEVIRGVVSSRKHPLPSVQNALDARVETQRTAEGGRRLRRVTLEEVRDAARELGTFYPEDLAEKLGISRVSLTKKGGPIPALINRSIPALARHRSKESGGRYYYEYLRPGAQTTNRAKVPPPERVLSGASQSGSAPTGQTFKANDPKAQALLDELVALGAPIEQGGSHIKVCPPGHRPITISRSKMNENQVKKTRAQLRRAGINVKANR